jgi:extradiol dioxygenase family protein
MSPFHLAFAIDDIEAARRFYGGVLGCAVGREAANWIDFDFFGHQISAHLSREPRAGDRSTVDGVFVPLHHFGVLLPWNAWETLSGRLAAADWPFELTPRVRYEGEPGEQGTFFVKDPAGNALEFKAYRNPDAVYASHADAGE